MGFFALPVSLTCRVLSKWIDLKSFVRLDAAARVSKKCSVPLHDITQSNEFSIQEKVDSSNSSMLAWLLARKIKINSLQLNDVIHEKYLPRYLQSFGEFVREATFEAESDGNVIRLVAIYCKSLSSIRCDGGNEQVAALCDLLRCNPNLTELRLTQLAHEEDVSLLSLTSCPHLQRFSLRDSLITSFPWPSFVGPSLRRLHLEDLEGLTHADLIAIGHLCTGLEACTIRWMPVADATMQEFSFLCPSIIHFDMTGNSVLTDEGVKGVLQNLPNLRILAFHDCFALTSTVWRHIATYSKDKLVDISMDEDSESIGALADLLRTRPSIHTLQVDAVAPLTAAQMEPLLAGCGQMHWLVVHNALVSDEALCLVGKHCPRLQHLRIYCSHSTPVLLDAAPCALAHGCPRLRTVIIDNAEIVPRSLRRMWNSIRPQLCFDDESDGDTYNICHYKA